MAALKMMEKATLRAATFDDCLEARALLAAAYEYGMAQRCHVLEVIGLPENLRACVKIHKPLDHPMPAFPFFFKAVNPDLTAPLNQADGWYMTPYDGDSTLL